ncbi:hypothetical protein Tco_0855088 [Tanacetum coccineum]
MSLMVVRIGSSNPCAILLIDSSLEANDPWTRSLPIGEQMKQKELGFTLMGSQCTYIKLWRREISWKSSDEDDDNDDNQDYDDDERTESDNDGDDFAHPKLTTHDSGERHDEEDKEEDNFDPRVQTPSPVESTDDEDNDEEIQGANVEGDKQDEEDTNKEVKANELYRDVNVNMEGRDIEMTNAQQTNVQPTQETEDTHVIITAPVNLEGQQQSSSVSSGFVSNMLNPSPDTVSLIPGIVDAYLANKMHEAVKIAVQLQSKRLRDEAQAENADFINKLDDNIKKIIKNQVKKQVKAQVSKILPKIKKTVNEQLEAEVLTRLSNKYKTSHAVATNLFELELKNILIDKMERNKSITYLMNKRISTKHWLTLTKVTSSYLTVLEILFHLKDVEMMRIKTKNPPLDQTSKRRRARKEPESTIVPKEKTSKTTGKSTEGSKSHHKSAGESAQAEEPMHTAKDLEEPAHQEFKTGVTEDQPNEETFIRLCLRLMDLFNLG